MTEATEKHPRERLRELPKAELHVHLEGSISPETLREIDPSLTLSEIQAAMAPDGTFAGFLRSYIWVVQRLRTPEHYAIAARALFEQLQADGVRYAEITLSAGVVLWKEQDLAAVYDVLWRETQNAKIPAFWILDAIRHFGPEPGLRVAEFAVSRAHHGVVAFGIGGDEERGPAASFRDVFAFARDGGLHLVAHAGETCGPQSIWDALAIGAERIGHGIAAVNDAALLEQLRARGIPLEICISSNVATGVAASVDRHPASALYRAGIPLILNTDDPALFETTLSREYALAEDVLKLPAAQLAAASFRYAFRPEALSVA